MTPANTPIRVLIADDQAAIRSAFRMIIDAQPDMAVVAEAATGTSALDQARRLRPDVLLVDTGGEACDGAKQWGGEGGGVDDRAVLATMLTRAAHAAPRHSTKPAGCAPTCCWSTSGCRASTGSRSPDNSRDLASRIRSGWSW
jgi:CheY-like chemotaxis protein